MNTPTGNDNSTVDRMGKVCGLNGLGMIAIIFSNERFSLSLTLEEIAQLLLLCRDARGALNSKLNRFRRWCRGVGLLHRQGGPLPHLVSASEMCFVSRCFSDQAVNDLSWLVSRAEQGDVVVSFFLALVLLNGLLNGLPEPEQHGSMPEGQPTQSTGWEQVIYYLEKATDAGHSRAQYYLAQCLYYGYGISIDHTKAVQLYHGIANQGFAPAQIALGRCHEDGYGVDQDYDKAVGWYAEAAAQGDEGARTAIAFLRAWFALAGWGVPQSDVDAVSLWQQVRDRSAGTTHRSIALHMLGWMHYLGRGTKKDWRKGARLMQEGTSDEFPLDPDVVLAAKRSSFGSDTLAARKFLKLCEYGSERDWLCKHLVAVCMINGFGRSRNEATAFGIFEELANQGHSDSQFWTGKCYFDGLGVSVDKAKAFEWSSKAAGQGNSYGQRWIGYCYEWGAGVSHNRTKAIEWYRRSADQSNRDGQDCIRICNYQDF